MFGSSPARNGGFLDAEFVRDFAECAALFPQFPRAALHLVRDPRARPIERVQRNHGHRPAISLVSFANSMTPASAVMASAAHAIAEITRQHP